jgi:predicted nuclease of predicted toxin-antitoxin system
VANPKLKFLVDEMLSLALPAELRGRGFVAEHVNDIKPKHKTGGQMSDHQVAKYAIDRDMIVLTRNIVDFKEIYIARELHPGIVFFHCDEDHQFIKKNQLTMLAAALAVILGDEPIQEAIEVKLLSDDGDVDVWRTQFPDHTTDATETLQGRTSA